MTLDPILNAPVEILIHLVFAAVAIVIGPFALFRTRRDRVHKVLGYIWLSAMTGLAISGLFIHSEFPLIWYFGPIHLFSFLALWGVFDGIRLARQGNIAAHQATMKSLWYGAIGVSVLLTFWPGRTLNRVLFGEPSFAGFAVIAVGLVALLALYLHQRRRLVRSAA